MNTRIVLPMIVGVVLVIALIAVLSSGGATRSGASQSRERSASALRSVPPTPPPPPPPQLRHAALLIRHTVRAPRVFPPADPLLQPALFPRGVARSTRQGLEATRNATLFVWQQWYKDLVTGDPNEVYARSSQADRCHETLAMILHTWYPSPDDLPLSQVAIRMPPRGNDKYVENCGNMRYITRDYDPLTRVPGEIAAQEGFQTVGEYVDFLKNMTGLHNESVNFFYMAYMEGFVSIDFEQRFTADDHWMLKYPKTREFARLYLLHNSINVVAPYYAHYLMTDGIGAQLLRASQHQSSPAYRLSLFSFHDLNLLSVLRALGVANKHTEPLAVVAFELWQDFQPARWRVAVRMSEGLTTDWTYQPGEYITIRTPTGQKIEELGDVLRLMQSFYQDRLNVTAECGYFGADAKI